MARHLITLLLLYCAVSPALSQDFGVTDCSSNPLQYGGYLVSYSNCCTSYVITNLLRQCCVDRGLCRCSPSLSVSVCPTATTTTTTTTTTTLPPAPVTTALCPQTPITGRLLNAALVSSGVCSGSGTIGFTTTSGQVCNGAFSKDPTTGAAVIYTLGTCWAQNPTTGLIGGQTIPLDGCFVTSVTSSPLSTGVVALNLSPMAAFFLSQMFASCPNTDCLYNPFIMATAINWSKCFVSSYGTTTIGGTGGQLNTVPVILSDATQCFNMPTGSQCFVSSSGSGSPCVTDDGGPVYCSLNTGEVVLYGLTSVNTCTTALTSYNVKPLFGAIGTEVPLP